VLKRNLIANFLGQGWTALMAMAFVPLYISYLGIEAYGLIGVFALLQAWLVLLDLGMSPTLSRELARFTGGAHDAQFVRDLLRSVELVALGIAALIAATFFAGSRWLATDWLKVENLDIGVVAHAFTLMGCVTALRFLESIYRSSMIGLQRHTTLNMIIAAMMTLRSAGAVAVLAWWSPTIGAFFAWQLLLSVLTLGGLAIFTYRMLPPTPRSGRMSLPALRSVCGFAGGMLGVTLLAVLLTQADKILLSRLLSLSNYGYYALAAVVAGGLYMLVGPIAQAHQPRLSELHAREDHDLFVHTYHRAAQLVAVVVGSAAVTLIVHSGLILELWSADPHLTERSARLLSILAFGNLLHTLMIIPYHAQLAYGWTRLALIVNTVAVTVVIPAILLVTPRYGAEGAAWVWCALNIGYLFISVHFMFRRILTTEKWRWYRDDVAKPLLAGAAVSVASAWLMPTSLPRLFEFIVLVFVAGVTLLAACLAASTLRGTLWSMASRIGGRT
jgi:O-antigen/teichoic acid export membrane protein